MQEYICHSRPRRSRLVDKVFRLGWQCFSWGNNLIYHPLNYMLFNLLYWMFYRNRNRNTLLNQLRTLRVYNLIQWLQWLEYITQIKLINYNSVLPGGKQATKGDKKINRYILYGGSGDLIRQLKGHEKMTCKPYLSDPDDIKIESGVWFTQSSPDRRACKITFLFCFQTINFELLES
jgi:hypothetical protein